MIKFGTGGWRAFIGEDFTKKNVQLLSQALANLMKNEKCEGSGFVIGYDNRFLSDKSAKWVSEVMAGNGIKVFLVGKSAPTPLIMFTVNSLDAYYGAAVTASHNPADYNGLKIFTRGGRDAKEDVTRSLEEIINNITIDDVKLVIFDKGIADGLIEIIDPFNEFIDSIISMIDIESIRNSKLKVALDPMFGVSKTCLQTILLTARCEVEIINNRHDTLFGGRLPSPSTHTLHRLKDLVVEKGYDIGIGTDGDADRLGIIDEKGNFIHPNDILSVLYYYLLKYKGWKGGAVRNLATTHLLDKIAASFGEECYEVPVGFKNISSKMEEKNALIGGESSGGLTIRGHIKGKDGIFAASLLIELLSVTGKSLSELLEEIHKQYGYFYMTESDYKFSIEDKEQIRTKLFVNKLIPNFGYKVEKTNYEDGLKVYFRNGGWIIARFSGTEPLLRVFSEMENEAMANEISNIMREFLNL
ncbi:phosphoglucomutase/phosphomannomutase family protein [Clostridium sp. CM028]|uniref:phosphoglucomutase/phosphomannomutase family protein n=1 Tax=unclassified Clostridium TaxID=2614128 RepID=UPI001C0B0ABC|nr:MULTISPECIES: phosphoglucomutase/phosphomannomutase family protein [unclassified Clostridium]MBU3093002.1 phosphoglucomutase/phosphomannomutase family protein [Clostridium sp. CF011]MBW9146426.1 phosphoglucomutase/phosphomannomutase family protein [Clostridium sp. CM027]MBW9149183.1 phosphoglucomutase/phosphomannomutase family protein [Clostridium sp. CM028]UVE41934.1 phosphoglucomutase/phosphomannomutase family protein [Clostridium sp. CM027]WAG70947.1 phosphoglucomutase/phosphomannomutase